MLDKVDLRILRALESDGRISFSALADAIGLSKTPCWSRAKQLEESGVIRNYRADLEPSLIGLSVSALVYVTVDFSQYKEFELTINEAKNVYSCHAVTGEADYVLHIYAKSISELDEILRESLSKTPGVTRFTTSIVTRDVKTEALLSAI